MTTTKKAKAASTDKDKKPKLVRDSFTIPKNEYLALDSLKIRALQLGVATKKSELLRAGLMALAALGDGDYKAALAAVPTLKTGRPSSKENKPTEAGKAAAPKAVLSAPKTTAGKKTPATRRVAAATPAPAPVTQKAPARKAAARPAKA